MSINDAPPAFCVAELVDVLASQSQQRMPWSLDEVQVTPFGDRATVGLIAAYGDRGSVRMTIEIHACWVDGRPRGEAE